MRQTLKHFRCDDGGLAAVEFAFILPVMLTLFFGVIEVSQGLSARADVNNVASTTADLVAQASTISSGDMTNIFAASSAILYPNAVTDAKGNTILKIVVTSLVDNGTATTGKVSWSQASTGKSSDARSTGGTATIPAGLMTTGDSVIMSEVTYTYKSATSQSITGPITMTSTFYTKPRRVAQIAAPS